MRLSSKKFAAASGIAVLALGASATTAGADEPDFVWHFPAGVACAEFDLHIEGTDANVHSKDFVKDDQVVRTITAGKGGALTFTNLASSDSVSFRSNGVAVHTTYGTEGLRTVKMNGHSVLIMYPTDDPAGPSTTLYVGQVVFTADSDEVFTLQSTSGTATDICALLS